MFPCYQLKPDDKPMAVIKRKYQRKCKWKSVFYPKLSLYEISAVSRFWRDYFNMPTHVHPNAHWWRIDGDYHNASSAIVQHVMNEVFA